MAALASVIRSNSSTFFHFGSGTGKTIFSTHLNYGTFISGNTTNFSGNLEQNINHSSNAQGIHLGGGTLVLNSGKYSFNIESQHGNALGILGNGSLQNHAGVNSLSFKIRGMNASGIKIEGSDNNTLNLNNVSFTKDSIKGTKSSSGLNIGGSRTLTGNISFKAKSIQGPNAYGVTTKDANANINGVTFEATSIQGSQEAAGILSKGGQNTIKGFHFGAKTIQGGEKSYGLISEGGTTNLRENNLFKTESISALSVAAGIFFRKENSTVIIHPSTFDERSIKGPEVYMLSLQTGIKATIKI